MESALIILVVLLFVVFPLWAIYRIISLGRENDALADRMRELDRELVLLRDAVTRAPTAPASPLREAQPASEPKPSAPVAPSAPSTLPTISVPPAAPSERALSVDPPPLRAPPPPVVAAASVPPPPPPPLRPAPPPLPPVPAPEPSVPSRINWEHFMGAKLFAWIGGFAALLAVAYFLKYSFDHDLIPPEVRVALGFVFAIGLVIGGLKLPRERYAILAQSLIATGIVSLYAVTFACNSVYHFALFGPLATFAVMVLVTTTAFLLAVRLDAKVIAILGMLGGFLTPVLLSTGKDNPPGLFGYLALLDVGLIAVALHRRWFFLFLLSAAGTVIMQIGWAIKFFAAAKAETAAVVCLGFCVLYLGAYFVARRLLTASATPEPEAADMPTVPSEISGTALAFPFVAFGFAFLFLNTPGLTARPGFLFTFVALADVCLLALAWVDEQLGRLHLAAGIAAFVLLAAWTAEGLTNALLPWGLAIYLGYAVLHSAYPLLLQRHRDDAAPTWWSQLFPPLSLLLLLGPILKLDEISLLFWPCVLLVDALAIAIALFTGALAALVAVLGLTLLATAFWIFQVPIASAPTFELLLVIGGFAALFFVATAFLGRRFAALGHEFPASRLPAMFGDVRSQLPAFSALLPFLLVIMMTQRLPLANPSPVLGLALLLIVMTLGLATVMTLPWLPLCALLGVAGLEYAWPPARIHAGPPVTWLAWFLLFYAIFTGFPFVFRRRFAASTGAWAVAALAGLAQFPLVYQLVRRVWPNDYLGLLPAAFAVAPLLSLVAVSRQPADDERTRLNQLAWYGGAALLFITLIFPIQFERQWLTLSWALEGAALLWLFHRVPHRGLQATGVVLLITAFVRLALNPAVLEYHARSQTAVLNWYLYSYGVVAAALFVGARLLAPPRNLVLGRNVLPLLNTLGTVLAFLLLNIEIADFFSAPGARVLTFQFSGNFARDMSYTIAWALFALVLLLVSIWKGVRAGRFAALGLLSVAILKLFLHDLSRLDSLYRIGALFAVAVIATVASFAYQRFLPSNEKPAAKQS